MIIDVFSKYGWIVPLKDKKGETVTKAFQNIFKKGRKPEFVWTDKGSEFYNRHLKDLLRKHEIELYSTENEEKSSVVERWNRTIKNRMWKEFTAQGNSPMSRDGHLSMKSRRCVLLFTATVATATPRRNMPNKDRCCVPLCHNKRSAESRRQGITFHRFPAIKKAKKDWVIKIRRDVGKFFKVSRCFLFALFHIMHKLVHFFPPAADRGC